jgi:hypothetical protein
MSLMAYLGVTGVIVMEMPLEVAGLPTTQVALLVITHVTTSPLVQTLLVYELLLVPTFTPFFFHWYVGVVPPFVATAVKVMLVLACMVAGALDEMLTDAVTVGVTFTAIDEDVPVQPLELVTVTK